MVNCWTPPAGRLHFSRSSATPDFRLLIFQGRRHAAETKALVAIGQRVRAATDGLVIPTVITSGNTTTPGRDLYVLNDPGQRTHVCYGATTPSLHLIRPDGYVGFRCHAVDEGELVNYLRRHYGIEASTSAGALAPCSS